MSNPSRSRGALVAAGDRPTIGPDTRLVDLGASAKVRPRSIRRGASRPTIVLGFAALGGVAGMVVGTYLAFQILGSSLPDHTEGLAPAGMAIAGAGWAAGAFLGWSVAPRARPPGPAARVALLAGTATVAIATMAIMVRPDDVSHSERIYFALWRSQGAEALTFLSIVCLDAALVVGTVLLVCRRRSVDAPEVSSRWAGGIAIAGLVVGGLTFALGVTLLLTATPASEISATRTVSRTTSDVARELARYVDRTGTWPTTLDEVRAARRKIRPGTQVEYAGVVDGSYCLRVGIDAGEPHAVAPYDSALVHRRPIGARSWTSSEIQVGNSCSF